MRYLPRNAPQPEDLHHSFSRMCYNRVAFVHPELCKVQKVGREQRCYERFIV
jgi:hypothetical protein